MPISSRPLTAVFRHRRLWAMLAFAFIAFPGHAAEVPVPRQAVYVWQRQWTFEVRESLTRLPREVDTLMVLVGELEMADGAPRWRRPDIEWTNLAATERAIWPVVRLPVGVKALVARGRGSPLFDHLAELAATVGKQAAEAGCHLAGWQVDYDCPTARLDDYADFLATLAARRPWQVLTITALPTWLDSGACRRLVQPLHHVVLQVHSLEKPETINDPVRLVDPDRVPGWLQKMEAHGVPFVVALPTYSYRLDFTADGSFAGILGGMTPVASDHEERLLTPDAESLAKLVTRIQQPPPEHWRGFAWFRLPVEGNDLAWPWPTLQAVMAGRPPKIDLDVTVTENRPRLFDLAIANRGETDLPGRRLIVEVTWEDGELAAMDVLHGWHAIATGDRRAIRIVGPAPAAAAVRPIGWLRLRPGSDAVHITATVELEKVAP